MAALRGGDQVYATLLLNDTYLPGALVLAHSLRDAGTSRQLAVLVTLDTVSAEVITELKAVYDHVIPVPRIRNDRPANLYLMNRPDLHSAFTKVNLWRQTQFSKIVYIDADVVAYRAPDELFDIAAPFSAAPDIGWPDLFNTGVMVLSPNMGDYYALMAMAERGISFDGADQGLLNMHFKNTYNRISFTYNVTPSAHYQYVPAYRHFQSSINMVHFIGPDKPWFKGRQPSQTDSPFEDMVGRWWAVYDRHYRATETKAAAPPQHDNVPEIVQYFTKGEFQPQVAHVASTDRKLRLDQSRFQRTRSEVHHRHLRSRRESQATPPCQHGMLRDSRPEALNFPSQVYEMSQDTAPFVPPERYPSPPRNMWYEVPKEKPAPPTQKPRPIFPWEVNQPKPTRIFTGELASPSAEEPSSTPTGSSTTGQKSEPSTPATPTIRVATSDPWNAFTRTNAWDEVPEIERYVEGLQKHRRGRSQGSLGGTPVAKVAKEHGLKLTDFPSVVDRPSLPVTPAPIRRPKFWGGGGPGASEGDDEEELPAAHGVPPQSDWDPAVQLQKLAKQQSEALLKKLGGEGGPEGVSREIPTRPLPFGSEGIFSPTYVAQSSGGVVLSPQPVKGGVASSIVRNIGGETDHSTAARTPGTVSSSSAIPEPSYQGPGAAWEKGEDVPLRETPALPTEQERDVLDT
ncbi:Glycogenin-1 [Colletotrichum sp. SAR 10_86]|nr:Glycogenin-1 [Colletotrichum sp. SAR 10_65]KAI8177269.1 Glycogenin-1 [Colletotrichum sp. SAR 10_75]KAI8203110.1 Glycogenin-1 [Colletotrichum sp. SAR 10_76]KAI8212397.1 Glycogenin-1 [Colletotrichum sp. SAR 10_77]KAI8216929.1 Glycogenin-1 [Colletotrichum sp. SAR 10_86]KAJ4997833.1 Glycogenin-1 [Colletotrichum sp. SAR 10_66]